MKVILADTCGFCHGVKNAISMADQILATHKQVYSLGSIIHNKDVVERLAKKGLKTVNDIGKIDSGTVLIRSHGAAPQDIKKMKEKGLKIVDATCVLVKRVQHIVKQLSGKNYKVVVIGDEKHPEVQAVVSCGDDVVVMADESDLHKLPENAKLGLVCQTTQSRQLYSRVICSIAKQGFSQLNIINTLCREVIKRQEAAIRLCKQVDIMFVLGGFKSANTRKLAELCKKHNKQTFHLQNRYELDRSTLAGKSTAGITAGASTPDWVIKEFVEELVS